MNAGERIEKAIGYLEKNYLRQPSLHEISSFIGLSEFHFQRLFQKWVGVSPKKFLQYLTIEHAKSALARGQDLLSSTYDSGLSSPGRLHDLFVTIEAMTPGEYKLKGLGLDIRYGFHSTPFGLCLVGATDRGICFLSFFEKENKKKALEEAKEKWPKAKFILDQKLARKMIENIFSNSRSKNPIKVLLGGSKFQLKVWEALLKIPSGVLMSYENLAKLIDHPRAARAVGTALAQNAVSYLIPCHRVIQSKGIIGQYRWGTFRKHAIVSFEQTNLQ